MLRQLADDLWVHDSDDAHLGMRFGARMTVVRLPDGGLWVHSPLDITQELKAQLDALGPVRHIIVPSSYHYLCAAAFAQAYPSANVYTVPTFKRKLKGVTFHARLGDTPDPAWADVIDQTLLRGSWLYDEADFFHRPSRTLLLTDLAFNIPLARPWPTRLMARAFGFLGRFAPSVSYRLTLTDRTAARASLLRILHWDFDRIILSHGDVVESGGRAVFERAFARWLR